MSITLSLRNQFRKISSATSLAQPTYKSLITAAPDYSTTASSTASATAEIIRRENQFGAHNYEPMPVALCKGEGVFVWDMEGKKYFDFLGGYSSVNQGHRHPKIVQAMKNQLDLLTLTSRAFYNDAFGEFAEYAIRVYLDMTKYYP